MKLIHLIINTMVFLCKLLELVVVVLNVASFLD